MSAEPDLSAGKLMLAEIHEFGSFRPEVQRYICRSLDVAFSPGAAPHNWARNEQDSQDISAQTEVYEDLPAIRGLLPNGAGKFDGDKFLMPLIVLTIFDLSCSSIGSFGAYRFLYERLLGARIRPWLATAFCAAAGLPHFPAHTRKSLVESATAALSATWSMHEPTFFPRWLHEEQGRCNLFSSGERKPAGLA